MNLLKKKNNFTVGVENKLNKDKLGMYDSEIKSEILRFY